MNSKSRRVLPLPTKTLKIHQVLMLENGPLKKILSMPSLWTSIRLPFHPDRKKSYFFFYSEILGFSNKWLPLLAPEIQFSAEVTIKNFRKGSNTSKKSSQQSKTKSVVEITSSNTRNGPIVDRLWSSKLPKLEKKLMFANSQQKKKQGNKINRWSQLK